MCKSKEKLLFPLCNKLTQKRVKLKMHLYLLNEVQNNAYFFFHSNFGKPNGL